MKARARTERTQADRGWDILHTGGWYVARPLDHSVHKVFEAPTLQALLHKIQLWSHGGRGTHDARIA